MTTYIPPKKNTQLIFYMGLVSQSNGQFQANPTLAAGDVKVATDDGAPANIGTLPVVDADFTKRIKVTLSNTEMNGDNVTVIFSDAAGSEWDDVIVNIQTSTLQIDDLATPTNITAGTITTVTNLTNLPAITSNWLTAAGISAGALNGKGDWNIGKTGYALSSAGIQAIWDALTSALTTVGSIGKLLVDNINATISSRLASASYTAPDNATISSIQTDTNDIQSRLPAALSGDGFIKADMKSIEDELTNGYNATLKLKKLDIQNEAVGDEAVFIFGGNGNSVIRIISGYDGNAINIVSDGADAAILVDNVTNGPAVDLQCAGSFPSLRLTGGGFSSDGGIYGSDTLDISLTEIINGVWNKVIETGYTALQSMRLILSAAAAKLSGAATTTVAIRDVNDTKDRITATVDADGNRTSVTHDVS